VTYIGDDAFFKSQFAEVKLPDGLRHIGDGAFYDSKLTSITIPEGVDTVGNTCFGHCFSLLTVDFGPGVKVIGFSAINYAGPTKVILHEGLVEVQNLGISLCPDLTEIVLPSTLQKIGPKAFARCPFKSVVAKMPTPPAITEDVATRAFSDWTNYNGDSLYDYCTLHVPAAALEAYRQAPGWRLFKTILGDADGVEGIADDVRVTEIHTLDGLRVAEPVRGSVNIIRYSDGSVRKQYVP
jgi:surface antigen bspA-like